MGARVSLESLEGAQGQAPWPGQPVQRYIEQKHDGCIQGTRQVHRPSGWTGHLFSRHQVGEAGRG